MHKVSVAEVLAAKAVETVKVIFNIFISSVAEVLAAKAVETYMPSPDSAHGDMVAEVLAAKAVETLKYSKNRSHCPVSQRY